MMRMLQVYFNLARNSFKQKYWLTKKKTFLLGFVNIYSLEEKESRWSSLKSSRRKQWEGWHILEEEHLRKKNLQSN